MPINTHWFKSSYSGPEGTNCIEVALLNSGEKWFKSSDSGQQGGACVEISPRPTEIAIRDSKDKTGPILVVPAPAWAAFVRGLRDDSLGLPFR
ncbi:DUF397 domain-containing protein [Streptomyces sp. SAJ15]|uniref:DUF397 domain-containing protein n=1 Tax=Streptomyces sp. SAJ15 TaxID=2011095 RepID=UPI001184B150|nr:DUF397 domain-containing protein [Streptomyces sp. SAJ15]TVL93740.1 DUF397 domain-containing protein [Streptomyces sp. SAJ15]